MKSTKSIQGFFEKHSEWNTELQFLASIIEETELEGTIKWGAPTYTINGKNVLGIGAFKQYVGLWFHQGALLRDEQKKLHNAQEGVTKALRQWRFNSVEEMDAQLIKAYILEAIENEKQGKRIKPTKGKPLVIPAELQTALDNNPQLHARFEALSLSKKREYCEHIGSAKKAETRANRLSKSIPLLELGKGLNDKYRK